MPITFQQPLFLLLWLLIPVFWLMLRRSFLQKSPRTHRLLVGGLQSLLVLALGLALADPRLRRHSDQVNVLFCLDVSESIGRNEQAVAEKFMQQTRARMDATDQAGLVVFGKQPALEISLRRDFEPHGIQSAVNSNFTNLYAALQFALGKFPPNGRNKLVLFTDGNENLQNAVEMAQLAAALGVEIDSVPLNAWFGKQEVFLQTLAAPAAIPLATPYEIKIVVMSSTAQPGELVVLRNGRLLASQTVTLQAGKNVFTVTDTLAESGLYLYKAVINAPDDGFFQNNEGLAFTKGTRKSQILYLTNEAQRASPLVETLRTQGLELVPKNIAELTGALHDLLEYDAIILDNVSGQALSFATMEALEQYVKEMGGGLIMIGGDQSFGAGAYANTPVEKALPVFMSPPTDLRFSGLCLIFLIDKSSSMTSRYGGKSKLEMGKIAAFAAIELLNPTDSVGLVAFDWEFTWVLPITRADARQAIADELSSIQEGGGTNMYPALADALRVLQQTQASRKHVIILSDGRTEEADFQTLVQTMSQAGISVSTVAIGTDADRDLLQAMAKWGNGRSYYTEDADTIPRIFTGETKIVSKDLITEKALQPAQMIPHEILQGIASSQIPVIYGQVATYPKSGASVVLNTGHGPLLAAWQYGLGRSVAFTSDLSGHWSKDWVAWEHYGAFAAQMVKWAQRQETPRNYRAEITRHGEEGTFTVDVTDPANRFLNQLDLHVNVLSPSQNSQALALTQIAPGRYQATFPAEDIGEYYFSLFGNDAAEVSHPEAFGFGVPYTDEFSRAGVNTPLLDRLAALTKGNVYMAGDIPPDLFTVQADVKTSGAALWPYCALAFLGLLLVDVAVRKFVTLG